MRTRIIANGVLWSVILTNSASAQVLVARFPDAPGQGIGRGMGGPPPGGQIGMVAIEPFESGPPVPGAPYTADAITETTQVLADGNRISQRTSASIARDGLGRVRREQQAMVLGGLVVDNDVALVTITDPVSSTHVTLDASRRIAFRLKLPPPGAPARGGGPVPAGPALRSRRGGQPPPLDGQQTRTMPLGEQTVEGVRAEGVRTITTIAPNTIGNEAEIVVVSERWYSPDLRVVVRTERRDPRFGETVYRLLNISRVEPPADLFLIPPDYRIEEEPLPAPRVPARQRR